MSAAPPTGDEALSPSTAGRMDEVCDQFLKIPHSCLLDSPEDLERSDREARAAAQRRHPGVVTVHDVTTL